MSLFASQKMSLNESKNSASKSQRLKDSCLANTPLAGNSFMLEALCLAGNSCKLETFCLA